MAVKFRQNDIISQSLVTVSSTPFCTALGREALLLTEVHRSREVGRGHRRVCRQSVEVRDG